MNEPHEGRARRLRNGGPRRARALVGVERLEERQLLTIDFQSALGPRTGIKAGQAFPSVVVALDAAGNEYVAGTFAGAVNFNPNGTTVNKLSQGASNDAFVARYSPAGTLDWVRTFGSTGFDAIDGIVVDA